MKKWFHRPAFILDTKSHYLLLREDGHLSHFGLSYFEIISKDSAPDLEGYEPVEDGKTFLALVEKYASETDRKALESKLDRIFT